MTTASPQRVAKKIAAKPVKTAQASSNRVRGDAVLTIGDERYVLLFDFAAMAELEDAFEIDNIDELGAAIGENPGTRTIAKVIGPLIRSGGRQDFTDEMVRKLNVGVTDLLAAMSAALGGDEAPAAGE